MDRLREAGRAGDRAPAAGEVRFEEETSIDEWRQRVGRILGAIGAGDLEKAVLARRLVATSASPLRPAAVLDRLRRRYADCMIFAFRRGDACFLGATPERLVGLHGRDFQIDALAGSAPRGATVDEDERIGATLLADDKERREHAFVVEALTAAVEPLSIDVQAAATPRLRRMPNLQHLHTPVSGVLKDDHDVLDLVERLHPTPATGGLPREIALALLRESEPFSRGWYAGPVGWIDAAGGGEFAVALRSALVTENEALLYAGCGIVAGSEAEREYEEARIKLAAMRWALDPTPEPSNAMANRQMGNRANRSSGK
jgi:isochorismate synthase